MGQNENAYCSSDSSCELKSCRKEDHKEEKVYMKFFKQMFADRFYCDKTDCQINYIDDRDKQLDGIDFEMCYPVFIDDCYVRNVDAKSQLKQYIGRPTKTFCLEINSFQKGVLRNGWFVEDNKTDLYMFSWIHKVSNDCYDEDAKRFVINDYKDIKIMEIMFVEVKKLKKTLNNMGLTSEFLLRAAENMRNKKCECLYFDLYNKRLLTKEQAGNDYKKYTFKLVKSNRFVESPVLLVIKKDFYESICSSHYILKEKGIVIKKLYNKLIDKHIDF